MIESVYNQGDDLLNSFFDITIAPFGLFNPEAMKFRVTSFTHPDPTIGAYTIDYKGEHFEKPNYDNETGKEISFELRVDRYLKYYKKFLNWIEAIRNPDGEITEDLVPGRVSSIRSPLVEIRAVDPNNRYLGMSWKYSQVWPKSIGAIGADNTSQDAVTVSVTMSYLKFVHEN